MKRQIKGCELYFILMYANKKYVVQNVFTEQQREWLMNNIKANKPENCLCCPCFYWNFDNNGECSGHACTLNGVTNLEGEGECGF